MRIISWKEFRGGSLIPLPIKLAFLAIVVVVAVSFFLLFPPTVAEDLKVRIAIDLLLSVLAGLVGSAMLLIIHRARKESLLSRNLMEKITSQRQNLQTLFAISKTITTTMQLKPLLTQILTILMPIVDARSGVLWLVDQDKLRKCWQELNCMKTSCPAYMSTDVRCWSFGHTLGSPLQTEASTLSEKLPECLQCSVMSHVTLKVAASTGFVPGMKEPDVMSLGDSLCKNVLLEDPKLVVFHSYPPTEGASEQTCYRQVEWASQDPFGDHKKPKMVQARSCFDEVVTSPTTRIGMALVTKNQIHGFLCLGLDRVHYLTDDEAMLLTNAAALAASAIENADLYYQMEKRNQQITTLLKESHHRIKNNLQAIAGLCSMQLQQTSDPATTNLILDNLTRIRSISLVHQLLSQEDVKFVSLIQMIRRVMEMVIQLSNGAQKKVTYEIHGEDVKISSQKATAVALIINELTTNSIKHGFENSPSGNIHVTLTSSNDNRITLDFTDNGRGLPQGFCIEMYKCLGLQLVSNLVQDDLNGVFSLSSGDRTTARIEFRG